MSEMEELLAWLNDEDTLSLDAVEMAALAHYKLASLSVYVIFCLRKNSYILQKIGISVEILIKIIFSIFEAVANQVKKSIFLQIN